MTFSAESICNELNRNGLLRAQDIRNLHQRLLGQAGVYKAVHPHGNDRFLGSPKG